MDGLTNATAIGYGAQVGESNALVLGGTGGNAVMVGIGTPTPHYTLDVQGTGNFSGAVTASGVSASSFTGNGSGLTGVNAALLNGFPSSGFQPAGSYATLGANSFSSTQTVSGNVVIQGGGDGITFPDGSKQTTAVPTPRFAVCISLSTTAAISGCGCKNVLSSTVVTDYAGCTANTGNTSCSGAGSISEPPTYAAQYGACCVCD